MNKLVIVTGANGAIGYAFLESQQNMPSARCIGITRGPVLSPLREVEYFSEVDLLDAEHVKEVIRSISLEEIQSILFVHPVGKFKFEREGVSEIDDDKDGIDDEVLASNVQTFRNVIEPLLKKIRAEQEKNHPIDLTMIAFGSISEPYHVPYWQSYTKSKAMLRNLIHGLIDEMETFSMQGLFVNLSSVNTPNESKLRPLANTKYWLQPHDVVEGILKCLREGMNDHRWNEIDLYKSMPGFSEVYFTDTPKLLERWLKEMGKK